MIKNTHCNKLFSLIAVGIIFSHIGAKKALYTHLPTSRIDFDNLFPFQFRRIAPIRFSGVTEITDRYHSGIK